MGNAEAICTGYRELRKFNYIGTLHTLLSHLYSLLLGGKGSAFTHLIIITSQDKDYQLPFGEGRGGDLTTCTSLFTRLYIVL